MPKFSFRLGICNKNINCFYSYTQLRGNKSNLKVSTIDACKLPVIMDICNILNNSYTSLDAASDFDQDGFSTITPARGADWKGKDCRDNDPDAHPGRTPYLLDMLYDCEYYFANCNGIWGIDNETNRQWEEILCQGSDSKGIVYIGDSIGAHFHMPQVWINPVEFNWPSLNASDVLLDELDWPQYGFATGYKNITPNILIKLNLLPSKSQKKNCQIPLEPSELFKTSI
ncbi:hypothetical protein NQ317_019386 [Molorchus minor]|uniref:Uncharacterized protein n=1 Tax=Molorchus minor TaxID=1323400 RepID=A0ABQ9JDS9_9CUCU|nr:hypothetical protein NQ317_019386 [Molorchus minor]